MAVIQSRQDIYNAKIAESREKKKQLQVKMNSGEDEAQTAAAEIKEIDNEIARLSGCIEVEVEKQNNWKVENMRRKHNYIPFLLKFLKILAEKGQLGDLVEKAKHK